MDDARLAKVAEAKQAALDVLLHNACGPYDCLPRTAGWGYPEPYTRDLMISSLGILASGNERLISSLRRVLATLASNRTTHGHMPSFIHRTKGVVGASDTTPLFLMALALYRQATGEHDFLEEAAQEALAWMEHQSPGDEVIVGQLPTSDWRDEQWVLGFGLYVNTIVYTYLRLFGEDERAAKLRRQMELFFNITADEAHRHVHADLVVDEKPYYALWAYKVYTSERFDLLGNSLAVLAGIPTPERGRAIINWVEAESQALRADGQLAVELPPNLFPYIQSTDPDWLPRYAQFNRPGEYHNGGVWPFVCGFYVAAIQAAGFSELAEQRLAALTELVRPARERQVPYGFNEWLKAQTGEVRGEDWQTWSASMYLYAAACVEQRRILFFDEFRQRPLPEIGEDDIDTAA